jgi:hypothetical protein
MSGKANFSQRRVTTNEIKRAMKMCKDNIPDDCAEPTLKFDGITNTAFAEEIEELFFNRGNASKYLEEVKSCLAFFKLAFTDLQEKGNYERRKTGLQRWKTALEEWTSYKAPATAADNGDAMSADLAPAADSAPDASTNQSYDRRTAQFRLQRIALACLDKVPDNCPNSSLKVTDEIVQAYAEEMESNIFTRAKSVNEYQELLEDWVRGLKADLQQLPDDLKGFVEDLKHMTTTYIPYNDVEMTIDPELLAIDKANRNKPAQSTVPLLASRAPIQLFNKVVPPTATTASNVIMSEPSSTAEVATSHPDTATAGVDDTVMDGKTEDGAANSVDVDPGSEMTDAKTRATDVNNTALPGIESQNASGGFAPSQSTPIKSQPAAASPFSVITSSPAMSQATGPAQSNRIFKSQSSEILPATVTQIAPFSSFSSGPISTSVFGQATTPSPKTTPLFGTRVESTSGSFSFGQAFAPKTPEPAATRKSGSSIFASGSIFANVEGPKVQKFDFKAGAPKPSTKPLFGVASTTTTPRSNASFNFGSPPVANASGTPLKLNHGLFRTPSTPALKIPSLFSSSISSMPRHEGASSPMSGFSSASSPSSSPPKMEETPTKVPTSIVAEQETPTKTSVAVTEDVATLVKDPTPKTAEQTEVADKVDVVEPESEAPVEVVEPMTAGPAAEEKLVEKTSPPKGKDAPATVPAVYDAFMLQVISMLQAQEAAKTDAEAKRVKAEDAAKIEAEAKHQQLISKLQAQETARIDAESKYQQLLDRVTSIEARPVQRTEAADDQQTGLAEREAAVSKRETEVATREKQAEDAQAAQKLAERWAAFDKHLQYREQHRK